MKDKLLSRREFMKASLLPIFAFLYGLALPGCAPKRELYKTVTMEVDEKAYLITGGSDTPMDLGGSSFQVEATVKYTKNKYGGSSCEWLIPPGEQIKIKKFPNEINGITRRINTVYSDELGVPVRLAVDGVPDISSKNDGGSRQDGLASCGTEMSWTQIVSFSRTIDVDGKKIRVRLGDDNLYLEYPDREEGDTTEEGKFVIKLPKRPLVDIAAGQFRGDSRGVSRVPDVDPTSVTVRVVDKDAALGEEFLTLDEFATFDFPHNDLEARTIFTTLVREVLPYLVSTAGHNGGVVELVLTTHLQTGTETSGSFTGSAEGSLHGMTVFLLGEIDGQVKADQSGSFISGPTERLIGSLYLSTGK